jgi:DNA transformation protein and related proteins
MSNSGEFIAHVLEMMQPAGRASARAMFGGHGIYLDESIPPKTPAASFPKAGTALGRPRSGLIVAIVDDDVLYLKTDAETRGAFVAQGLEPFCYATKTGERQLTSYYRPPDEALESAAAMREWLRLALDAALRSANRKKPKAPRR